MTRTEVLEFWSDAQQLAGRMVACGVDRRKVDAFLASVADYCATVLEAMEVGA